MKRKERRSAVDENPPSPSKKAKKHASAPASKEPASSNVDFIDSIFSEKKKKKEIAKAEEAKIKKQKRMDRAVPKRSGEKSILETVFSKPGKDWVDDGLGGRFNNEGFTGRVEDGMKVFKAHVLNRPTAGSTKDCPFDCDCCFI